MEPWVSAEAARMITAGFLVMVNLVPVAGVLTLGWDVGSILLLYWMESAVVGLLNIVKMAMAQGQIIPQPDEHEGRRITADDLEKLAQAEETWGQRSPLVRQLLSTVRRQALSRMAEPPTDRSPRSRPAASSGSAAAILGRLFIIGFFCLHYGLFMAGHAVFLFVFFGPPTLPLLEAAAMLALLLVSHGVSFAIYFVVRGEYCRVSISEQMSRPYGRIMVMHITILLGGILVMELGAPILALLVLVALKTGIDLTAHLRSHARYETA
jgi:hypothetical protein